MDWDALTATCNVLREDTPLPSFDKFTPDDLLYCKEHDLSIIIYLLQNIRPELKMPMEEKPLKEQIYTYKHVTPNRQLYINRRVKLSSEQIQELYEDKDSIPRSILAKRYGVTPKTIERYIYREGLRRHNEQQAIR